MVAELKLHTQFLEDHLNKNEWFCGNDFSAADIELSFPIKMLVRLQVHPHLCILMHIACTQLPGSWRLFLHMCNTSLRHRLPSDLGARSSCMGQHDALSRAYRARMHLMRHLNTVPALTTHKFKPADGALPQAAL